MYDFDTDTIHTENFDLYAAAENGHEFDLDLEPTAEDLREVEVFLNELGEDDLAEAIIQDYWK